MKNERELFIVAAKKLGINTELVETPMGLMFKYGSTRDSFDIWQASASRDGYVIVNKQKLAKVLNCVTDDWLIDTNAMDDFNEIESMVNDEVKAMIGDANE